MHAALRNLEVIHVVSSHTEHGTLPALASACRAFQSPALNVLWRDLHSVEPLLRCLPADLFGFDRGCTVRLNFGTCCEFQAKFAWAGIAKTS
jgi:hypothetical protein